MNEISCEMCMDLIPLVKDGIASGDSRAAVESHCADCAACRALYDGETPPKADAEKAFARLLRQMRPFGVAVMMFGVLFGLGLTNGADVFYNCLLMPVIGALGYVIFRQKALFGVPLLLFVTHGLTNLFGMIRGAERLDLYGLLMWTGLYSVFALVGVVIAWLLHFALGKR